MSNGNSKSVPWKWVAIALATLSTALILRWTSDVVTRGNVVQAQTAANSAEIAALKAGFASMNATIASMNASLVVRLDRIENKVDALELRRR